MLGIDVTDSFEEIITCSMYIKEKILKILKAQMVIACH